jgi:hypothetical protein
MSEKENKYKKFILPVSLSIVFLVAGFGLGVLFQKTRLKSSFTNRTGQFQMMDQNSNNRTGNRTGQNGNNSAGPRNNNGGFVTGEITKIDDTSITLKTSDGSSKIVLIASDTTFNQSTTASKSDLKVGSKIMVTGATDTNSGSITGKTIQLNPATMAQPEAPKQ